MSLPIWTELEIVFALKYQAIVFDGVIKAAYQLSVSYTVTHIVERRVRASPQSQH